MEIKIDVKGKNFIRLDDTQKYFIINKVMPKVESENIIITIHAKVANQEIGGDYYWGTDIESTTNARIDLYSFFKEYPYIRVLTIEFENKSDKEITIDYILS